MSIDAVVPVHSDQARVDAAYQRLAGALALDKPAGSASPDEVERGHAAVGAARVALAQAEAAANASAAALRPLPQTDVADAAGQGAPVPHIGLTV